MCLGVPLPRWGLLLLLLLQPAGATMTMTKFQRMALSTRAQTQCLEAEEPLPATLPTSVQVYCALRCATESSCTAFCHTESSCRLLNMVVIPGGFPPGVGDGSQSEEGPQDRHPCFVLFKPDTPAGTDLARGREVLVPGTWEDYAPSKTVVRGVMCETAKTDCFCSSFTMTPFLKVDLGSPRSVVTVVVTVSSFFPDYFEDINVYVGDHADETDALLTSYQDVAGVGEVLTLRGNMSLVGRYVSLFSKNVVSSRSLCLCLIQVYSV